MKRLAIAVIALVVGLSSTTAGQSATAFTGRWRLTTPYAPAESPLDLIFSGPSPSQRILIERWLKTKVESESYSTDPNRPPVVFEARWMGAALVLRKPGYDSRGAEPSIPDHEEIWSLGPEDILRIVATDRPLGGAERTTHLAYRRVPVVLRLGENLVENPRADAVSAGWQSFSDATIQPCDGNPCFVVRHPGSFVQTILLPAEASGHFIVMTGAGASERINANGAITGLPYLHGTASIADLSRILGNFQGHGPHPMVPNQWTSMSGVFRVPPGTASVKFRLAQASGRGTPQNGSAARFDDLGFYLFRTEADARAFATSWTGRK